jgi:O-antigen/teichoic acid export membrane protein
MTLDSTLNSGIISKPNMSILLKSIKGTVWLTASRLLSVVFGAIATVFIARWLGPNRYGYLPLVSSILGIAMIFGDAGLGPSTAYYLAQHQDNANDSGRIVFKAFRLRLLTLIPVCVIFVLLMPYISSFVRAPLLRGALMIFAGSLFFVQIMSRWTGKTYEGLGQVSRLGKTQMFISWVSPLSQVLFVALGFGVLGAIGGQVFGNGIVVAILIVWLLRNYKIDRPCDSGSSAVSRSNPDTGTIFW